MLPYDSFLIDGPWLLSIGWFVEKIASRLFRDGEKKKKVEHMLFFLVLNIFYVTSISLYFNLEWTRWIWEMCKAESGRDWMINSGVFRFDHKNMSRRGHLLSALMFATYPVWLSLGFLLGKKANRLKSAHC